MSGDIDQIALWQRLQKLGVGAWSPILGALCQILARPAHLLVGDVDVFVEKRNIYSLVNMAAFSRRL